MFRKSKDNEVTQFHGLNIHLHEQVWKPTRYAEVFAEILADQFLNGADVLDVGSGTGVLAILCAKREATVTASDINDLAVELTRKNADFNHVTVNCVSADGLYKFENEHKRFDLIVCNPPTIPESDLTRQRPNKADWILSGKEGRNLLDHLLVFAPRLLKRGGKLLSSSSSEQTWDKTEEKLREHWSSFRVVRDEILQADHEIYRGHVKTWEREGKAWQASGSYFHSVRWFFAHVD